MVCGYCCCATWQHTINESKDVTVDVLPPSCHIETQEVVCWYLRNPQLSQEARASFYFWQTLCKFSCCEPSHYSLGNCVPEAIRV